MGVYCYGHAGNMLLPEGGVGVNEKETKRLVRVYAFFRALLRGLLARIFHFSYEIVTPPQAPYLVLVNHNTDFDPLLVSLSFPRQMRFVASEHVFRAGLWSRLLVWGFGPISRMKGATDTSAALGVMRALRRGDNVCLFAEGNRSYNGVTGPMFTATGKLAKNAGVGLITYKLTGGYFTTPRWGRGLRRGRMTGAQVRYYSPEELKGFTADALNERIAEDLYEDAFARQELEHIAYKGKNLAELLETALYICPRCGKIGALRSKGDRFLCACGLSVRYTAEGLFAADGAEAPPFSTVRDWDAWQNEQMAARCAALTPGEIAFSDEGLGLFSVDERHRTLPFERGALSMTRAALTLAGRRFELASISSMALYGRAALVFTTGDGTHYEIKEPKRSAFCARKYLKLFQLVKAEES